MRELQIFILDNAGNQLGELDLTDSDDFALKLSKSLASINDLGRRNTSYSLDFEAPQSKNNNKLLSGLRFATGSKEILGFKPCAIQVDGNQIDRGFLYPFESELDGMYKLNFKGSNNDWVEQLRDVELNELNWRDYLTGLRTEDATELFSSNRIDFLNTKNSDDADLVYPYLNRNNGGDSLALRPQLHLRAILLAMFDKIDYTINSAFLETDWVKGIAAYVDVYGNDYDHLGLSVDPAFQFTRKEEDLKGQLIDYSVNGITGTDPNGWTSNTDSMLGNIGADPTTPTIRNITRFPNIITTLVTDDFGRFDPVKSEFTVGVGGSYNVDFDFEYEDARYSNYSGKWLSFTDQGLGKPKAPSFTWYILKNNVSDYSIDSPSNIIYERKTRSEQAGGQEIRPQLSPGVQTFAAGDKISIFLKYENDSNGFFDPDSNGDLDYWRTRIFNGSQLSIVPVTDVQLNEVFRINSHIPDGIKCLNLLQDFKTMFNLYFDVDANRKIVFIEPRDDFYTGSIVDITEKVDLTNPPSLNYLTEYKNEFVFEYAIDSKDKFLEQWSKANDNTYAKLTYVMGNNSRFEKGKSVLSTSLLSATIQGSLKGSANIITSIVKEESLDADNEDKPVNKNYGPRVFQLVRGKQYDISGTQRRTSSPEIVLSAIMEEFGNTPTFEDRRLTFNATKGLVSEYYAKTLANIEDSAVLDCTLELSLYEFNSWDLRGVFHISAPAEISGYYITDSINNFNVTKETPTKVRLVKFKDFTPVEIPEGTGNISEIISDVPQPQEIMCTVNGAIVSCLDNDLKKMYRI